MTRLILAAALSALTLASPAAATDLSAMTDTDRAAFRDEVRAYLLDNPEVLMEAIAVLENRQANQQVAQDVALVASNAQEIFNDGYSWVGGNPDGDVTMVEFMDYRCGYCRKAYDEVKSLVETDGDIRLVVKELPILGEESDLSARFAIATKQLAGDEAYEKAHDALIKFRGKVSVKSLDALADKLDLDGSAVLAQMTAPEVDQVIQANLMLAQRMGINGTPTFVMDEQLIRGYVPLDSMMQIVAELRAQ